MPNTPTLNVDKWYGIRNKVGSHQVGLKGFTAADNVRIDGSGERLTARQGTSQVSATGYRGGFATIDKSLAYGISTAGDLIRYPASTLRSGFIGEPYWAEARDYVIVGNSNQTWRVYRDGSVTDNARGRPNSPNLTAVAGNLRPGVYRAVAVSVGLEESAPSDESSIELDGTKNLYISAPGCRVYICPANATGFFEWVGGGIYTGNPEFLGAQLKTHGLWPMPNGECVTFYQHALYSTTYIAQEDMSVVWRSHGIYHGLAYLETDIRLFPGRVTVLCGQAQGLFIGTDREIGVLTDEGYTKLTSYGVAQGRAASIDDKGTLWCLTQRGYVKAFPFAEVAKDFGPPTCDFVSTAILREQGDHRLIALVSPVGDPDNT